MDYELKLNDTETFYIVVEDESGQVLNDKGKIEGEYSYHHWSAIDRLVLEDIEDCRFFTDAKAAHKAADRLAKKHKTYFSVLPIVKSVCTIYTVGS